MILTVDRRSCVSDYKSLRFSHNSRKKPTAFLGAGSCSPWSRTQGHRGNQRRCSVQGSSLGCQCFRPPSQQKQRTLSVGPSSTSLTIYNSTFQYGLELHMVFCYTFFSKTTYYVSSGTLNSLQLCSRVVDYKSWLLVSFIEPWLSLYPCRLVYVGRRGQDFRVRLFVRLSVCLFVCLIVRSITQKTNDPKVFKCTGNDLGTPQKYYWVQR